MFDENVPQTAAPAPLPTAPAPVEPPSVPTPAVAAPAPAPEAAPAPRRSHKGLLIGVIVLVLMLVLAGGAGAYYFLVLNPNPDVVVGKSLQTMSTLESVAFDADFETSGTTEQYGEMKATLSISGATDFPEDTSTTHATTNVTFTAMLDDKNLIGPISASTITDEEVSYVNLVELNLPTVKPMAEQFGVDLDAMLGVITNRWIEINVNSIFDEIGIREKVDAMKAEQEQENAKYAPQLEAAVKEFLPQLFTITETLESEVIEGTNTHHYAYVVNEDAFVAFVDRLESIVVDDVPQGFSKESEDVQEFLDRVDDLHGELWIGKSDSYLYKMTLLGKAIPEEDIDVTEGLTIALNVNFSQFNEPVTVEAPAEIVEVKVLLEELMTAFSEGQSLAQDDADEDGLTAKQEETYGTDPENADSDGDGFSDGDEVDGGYNPNGAGVLPEEE